MKLVEILAQELKEWPNGHDALTQWKRNCEITGDDGRCLDIRLSELSEDYLSVYVTRAQWEAERARIAANQKATQEAREIARTGSMTSEEQELADIACGKRGKEDQEQIKEVASPVSVGYMLERDYEAEAVKQYDQELRDGIAKELFTRWTSSKSHGAFASIAFDEADAFMSERAKRMKG